VERKENIVVRHGSIINCGEKLYLKSYGGKNPKEGDQKKGGLTTMTTKQNNVITILFGLKGYSVGRIWEKEDRVIVEVGIRGRQKCPYCGSGRLYRNGKLKPREVLHTLSNRRKI